ncbi:anti-sigma-28 factor, FlgM family [Granulicella pectinivorans]|uniref:Anti-sigma-28 factor, FlgM family n=1 Tax=Granulicella pectinivorans TaxID=474950 RepID=A0A1I6MSK7_9BACT|nr:flagellar biosynthesis anti-sigma factor FlgM [Granulicella pectinivorans]SFS18702.1 anti-sigma-28 factor, FlgM family [Granulicella pectinivorans]
MNYSTGLNLQYFLGKVATADTTPADKASSVTGTATPATLQTNDQTQFSKASGLLVEALSGPDARMPRVLALSSAIAAGTYQVSSQDVAGKMLDALLQ